MSCFYASFFLGSLCRRMFGFMAIVYGFEKMGGGQWAGIFYFCLFAPYLAVGLFSGHLVDRLPKLRLLMWSLLCPIVLFGGLYLFEEYMASGVAQLRVGVFLGGIILIYGTSYTVQYPAFLAILPEVVGPERAERSTIWVNALATVSLAYAPLFVGALRLKFDWPWLFLSLAVLSASSFVLATRVKWENQAKLSRESVTFKEGLGTLFSYIAGNRLLGQTFLVALLLSIGLTGPIEVLAPDFMSGALGFSPMQVGLALSFGGTGLVIGAFSVLRIDFEGRHGLATIGSAILAGVSIFWMSYASVTVAVLLFFVCGLMMGVSSALILVIVQRQAKPEQRGGAFSVFAIIMGGAPSLGGLIAGSLSKMEGTVVAGRWIGMVVVAVFLLCIFVFRRMRRA